MVCFGLFDNCRLSGFVRPLQVYASAGKIFDRFQVVMVLLV